MAVRKPIWIDTSSFAGPAEFTAADTLLTGSFKAAGVGGVAFDANNFRVVNLPDPTAANEPATKGYADNIAQGVQYIPSVRALASGNQSLSGIPTIDGVQLVAGDRLLLVGQTNPVTNGVYLVQSGAWTRPTGAGGVSDWVTGRVASALTMTVREGANYADLNYSCITDGNPKIDTDPVVFTQVGSAGQITAGNGLQKTTASGNTVSVLLASASGLQFSAGALDHQLNPAGGLSKAAAGLAVALNANNTLAVDANGLRVLGVPSQFSLGGTATANTVTADSLGTLTAGTSSQADALHQHKNVLQARALVDSYTNGSTALASGDPVQWGSTANTLQKCTANSTTTAQVIGIALAPISANGTGAIIRRGVAVGVISGATPNTAYYLGVNGGLTTVAPTDPDSSVVRVGTSINSTDLEVAPYLVLARSAA